MLATLLLTAALVAGTDRPFPEADRLYAQGVASGVAGRFEDADQRFHEALIVDGQHIPSKRGLNLLDDLALQLVSRESAVLIFEGLAANYREDWSAARERYTKATQASPNYSLAFHNLGSALYQLGNTRAAIAADRKALELNPDYPYTYNNLGLAYARAGAHEKACESYRTAIALDPEYYKAYNNLGTSLRELGKQEEAVAAFRKALEINPRYSLADGNLTPTNPPREPGPAQRGEPTTSALIAELESQSYERRSDAARQLADRKDPSAVPDLLLLLEDERPFVRRNALHVLAHMREPKALAPALELLQGDPEWVVRFDAVTVLCWLGDQRAVPDARARVA